MEKTTHIWRNPETRSHLKRWAQEAPQSIAAQEKTDLCVKALREAIKFEEESSTNVLKPVLEQAQILEDLLKTVDKHLDVVEQFQWPSLKALQDRLAWASILLATEPSDAAPFEGYKQLKEDLRLHATFIENVLSFLSCTYPLENVDDIEEWNQLNSGIFYEAECRLFFLTRRLTALQDQLIPSSTCFLGEAPPEGTVDAFKTWIAKHAKALTDAQDIYDAPVHVALQGDFSTTKDGVSLFPEQEGIQSPTRNLLPEQAVLRSREKANAAHEALMSEAFETVRNTPEGQDFLRVLGAYQHVSRLDSTGWETFGDARVCFGNAVVDAYLFSRPLLETTWQSLQNTLPQNDEENLKKLVADFFKALRLNNGNRVDPTPYDVLTQREPKLSTKDLPEDRLRIPYSKIIEALLPLERLLADLERPGVLALSQHQHQWLLDLQSLGKNLGQFQGGRFPSDEGEALYFDLGRTAIPTTLLSQKEMDRLWAEILSIPECVSYAPDLALVFKRLGYEVKAEKPEEPAPEPLPSMKRAEELFQSLPDHFWTQSWSAQVTEIKGKAWGDLATKYASPEAIVKALKNFASSDFVTGYGLPEAELQILQKAIPLDKLNKHLKKKKTQYKVRQFFNAFAEDLATFLLRLQEGRLALQLISDKAREPFPKPFERFNPQSLRVFALATSGAIKNGLLALALQMTLDDPPTDLAGIHPVLPTYKAQHFLHPTLVDLATWVHQPHDNTLTPLFTVKNRFFSAFGLYPRAAKPGEVEGLGTNHHDHCPSLLEPALRHALKHLSTFLEALDHSGLASKPLSWGLDNFMKEILRYNLKREGLHQVAFRAIRIHTLLAQSEPEKAKLETEELLTMLRTEKATGGKQRIIL